jgi:polar amino acid transport system substrate-binding protein
VVILIKRLARAVALAALAVCAVASLAVARPLDEIVAANKLIVIAYMDNAPFSYDDKGTATGIDVDLAKAIARELGVKPEIILRMPAERQDADIRVNLLRGTVGGGVIGDLLMHVPIDRELALRHPETPLGNPYFQERIVVAIHPELTGENPTFDVFKTQKIGVQVGAVSDYFLMTYQDGVLIENISHHLKPEVGVEEFTKKEISAWMGVRSKIEAMMFAKKLKPLLVEPDMTGIVRTNWLVGMGWHENSRDLGYAVQEKIEKIVASGEMKKIFEVHGVTYIPPPAP